MGHKSKHSGERSYNFGGKHVFITGGSNGIGLAIAKKLLQRGASISLVDIADPKQALDLLDDVRKASKLQGKIFFTKADVGVYEQVSGVYYSQVDSNLCVRTLEVQANSSTIMLYCLSLILN